MSKYFLKLNKYFVLNTKYITRLLISKKKIGGGIFNKAPVEIKKYAKIILNKKEYTTFEFQEGTEEYNAIEKYMEDIEGYSFMPNNKFTSMFNKKDNHDKPAKHKIEVPKYSFTKKKTEK